MTIKKVELTNAEVRAILEATDGKYMNINYIRKVPKSNRLTLENALRKLEEVL